VNKLNAISNLNTDDLDFSKYTDIYDLIRGRFSGVTVVNGEVIVRGKNTFDNSTNAALIVVDGVPRDESSLSNIPTDQVKSIDIIKDGGAAIYGVQGANGVVVIQTRRGDEKNGK
jgi:TonB-dependent SusC/RagA subfamily outer membrane receptor